MSDLRPGTTTTVDGVAIHVGAVRGTANPGAVGAVARSRGSVLDPELLAEIRARRGDVTKTIELAGLAASPPPAGARAGGGRSEVSVQPPPPGPDFVQVVHVTDADGFVEWIFPEAPPEATTEPTRGGAGDGLVFVIPMRPKAPSGDDADRSAIGAIAGKIIRVIVLPLVRPLVGALGASIAEYWESKNRVARLRDFMPDSYGGAAGAGDGVAAVGSAPEPRRALLFIHGTFSTTHACFGALPQSLIVALHSRYQSRVLAYDHPTLAVDPTFNANALVEQLTKCGPLELDVVAHSRGGLVARALARALAARSNAGRVLRIVHVGSPNAGTPLADGPHMKELLDTYTNLLELLPASTGADVASGVVTAVEEILAGTVDSLPGLRSMVPNGEYLRGYVADESRANDRAIASEFSGSSDMSLVRYLASRAAAGVMASALGGPSDLVVPNASTWAVVGGANRLRLVGADSVVHTAYFGSSVVANALAEWLV